MLAESMALASQFSLITRWTAASLVLALSPTLLFTINVSLSARKETNTPGE